MTLEKAIRDLRTWIDQSGRKLRLEPTQILVLVVQPLPGVTVNETAALARKILSRSRPAATDSTYTKREVRS